MIKRALVSVSDKTGLVEFAKVLQAQNIEIISTGGTKKVLEDAGIDVIQVSDFTGFPEILDGRVKTLHPLIYGGLLALRDNVSHRAQMEKFSIKPIDLVVVNLYPFRETIAKLDVKLRDAIENIDIGGPTMVRAAAKNFQSVTIVVDPKRYPQIAQEIIDAGGTTGKLRMELAQEAFKHTSEYDNAIQKYLLEELDK